MDEDGVAGEVEECPKALLREAERLFGLVPVGDVEARRDYPGDSAVLGPEGGLGQELAPRRTVAENDVRFVGLDGPVLEDPAVPLGVHPGFVYPELRQRLSDDLIARPVGGGGERRVAEADATVPALCDDWSWYRVQQLLNEARLLPERLFGPPAVGYVALDREDCRPAAELYATGYRLDGDLGPVTSNVRRLEDVNAALHDLLHALRN